MASRMSAAAVDGVLVQWGDRLFYPRNRIGPTDRTPRLSLPVGSQAARIRRRIEATVMRRAPQVMVKVTGGGRGMGAIAAHFRYISKAGRLAFEDDRGVVREGREALHDLAEQWRYGGSLIGESSSRREAFNLMLSMPRGTDPHAVLQAAREFARIELKDHRYMMVLHEHQENPHVHLSVRAESKSGQRLNPRKADLHRWREILAERLRGQGIEAEATRQTTRLEGRRFDQLWQREARKEGRLRHEPGTRKSGKAFDQSLLRAVDAWAHITQGLEASEQGEDRQLAKHIRRFLLDTDYTKALLREREREGTRRQDSREAQQMGRDQPGPEITR